MEHARYVVSIMFGGLLALGCASDSLDHETQGAATSTSDVSPPGSVTSAPDSATDASTMATATVTAPGTSGSTSATCNFVNCNDDFPDGPCDVFDQDCPEGQKCTPHIADGDGAWNDAKCVQVSGTDKPGDMCTSEEGGSGIDSCIKGAICWGLNMDNVGTCVAQCTGSAEAPVCDAPTFCYSAGDDVLHLCLKDDCDPLQQDCLLLTEVCYPFGDGFICTVDDSGAEGQANDPCEFTMVCDKGLMCADAAIVGMGCAPGSTGCCTPFCKFSEGTCPNPDQQCVQYFDPSQLPPNDPYLDIGFCGLPL